MKKYQSLSQKEINCISGGNVLANVETTLPGMLAGEAIKKAYVCAFVTVRDSIANKTLAIPSECMNLETALILTATGAAIVCGIALGAVS